MSVVLMTAEFLPHILNVGEILEIQKIEREKDNSKSGRKIVIHLTIKM